MFIEREIEVPDSIGLLETLNQMKIMELESLNNYFFQHQCNMVFGEPNKNLDKEKLLRKVFDFVSKNFKYKDDELDETLISPKYMFFLRTGDCDDFALFIKTVLRYYGIESNYLLCGKTEEGFTHIVVVANDYILDATNDKFNYLDNDYKFTMVVK